MNGEVVLAEDVAETFTRVVMAAFDSRRRDLFSIALSGGTTARRCYERLAEHDDAVFWRHLELFWGDERCVPVDDEDSNHLLARRALGERFAAVHSTHPMTCADDGAERYNALLAASPPLDLVHLGLGPDGHTASLFPGSAALRAEPGKLVSSNLDTTGTNPHRRLTLTQAGITSALLVVVTVEGVAKRDALHRVLEGDRTLPATDVDAENLLWIVDADALGASRSR